MCRTLNAFYSLSIIIILQNYIVNAGIVCELECICRHVKSDDLIGEYIDCSYRLPSLISTNELPNTAHSLILSMNNITTLEKSRLLRSKSLVELFLNQNKIKEINNAFELPELRFLDLSENDLEFIHEDTFKGMPKLEYLKLSNNLFKSFDKLTFHYLYELKEIVLDNNDIGQSLGETNLFDNNGFGLTNKIQSISIRGINLNRVPENFFVEAYDLKKLVISKNNLTELSEIPYTLEYLDISDNPIREISMEDFSDLPGLKELKINNLQIREVPDFVFLPLRGLINLELERNRNLTRFSEFAFGKQVLEDADNFILQKLSLKGSRIRTLDEKLMEPFGQLTKLDLQGNPWNCDCYLLWLKKLQIEEHDRDGLRCATPRQLYDSQIFSLSDKYFICPIERHYAGLTIAVLFACVTLVPVALWIFIFLPKYQNKGCCKQEYCAETAAAYSIVPLGTRSDDYY